MWKLKRHILKSSLKRYPFIPILTIFFFALMAIFANLLVLHSPYNTNLYNRLIPPFGKDKGTMTYILGTDTMGRDILSRIIMGARISFIVALLSIFFGGIGGSILGMISGYFGGRIDEVLMRLADISLAFPIVFIAVLFAVTRGPSLQNVTIAISVVLWARYARVIRGETLSIKERDFVALARIAGCSHIRIILRHITPNVLSTLLVMLTLQVGWVIMVEASLSFIGAGVPPPTPTWGGMIAEGRNYLSTAWWISLFPGLAMLFVILSFNLLGDWLREALDPKLRQVAGVG